MYEQLAAEMRRLIMAKTFVAGEKVPSIRTLSQQLSIAPTTVRRAFQLLIDEGWLEQSHGSGTYIADTFEMQAASFAAGFESGLRRERRPCEVPNSLWQNTWASRLASVDGDATEYGADAVAAPVAAALLKPLQNALVHMDKIGSPGGNVELRRHICAALRLSRAINCTEEDVIIVNGVEQARAFAARLFVDPGTTVAVEDPCPFSVKNLFYSFGANLAPVPVDESGLVIEELERLQGPAMLYVTPSAQNPTGAVLARRRREYVANWAARSNCLIIEEDSGCDFIYESRQTAALASFDHSIRTIYIGSFEQTIPVQWRLAYMVVPPAMREACFRLKLISDRATTPLAQAFSLHLYESDQIGKQIVRNQRHYQKLRDHLVSSLKTLLPDVAFAPVKGGLRQMLWLDAAADDVKIVQEARRLGIHLYAVSPLFLRKPARPGLIIDFSDTTEAQLEATVSVIKELVGVNGT